MNARKTILFDGQNIWCKKGNNMFDVSMGSYDGSEVCELIGLYLLYLITDREAIIKCEDTALYRDDGLVAIEGNGRTIDKTRKNLEALFKRIGLKITYEVNIKRACFLDILLDLDTGTYRPYTKKNSRIQYVCKGSNHPPNVLNNLPLNVNRRLQNISSNQPCFDSEKLIYQEAISKAGYDVNLEYGRKYENNVFIGQSKQQFGRPKESNNHILSNELPNKRRRNVLWFNPPFNVYSATKVGKEFRMLIDKHFSKDDLLSKLFNKNKLKLSYSCMGNIKSKIASHNRRILSGFKEDVGCNCRQKAECPLEGKCTWKNVIYQAEVFTGNQVQSQGKLYVGLASGLWKLRFANHNYSFRNFEKREDTELSKYIWELKNKNVEYRINWKIIGQEPPYSKEAKKCRLCLREQIEIIKTKT